MASGDPQEQADLLDAVDRFVAEVDRSSSMLTSRSEVGVRQCAAAALVRGCSLIASGAALVRSGHSEGVGLLARAAWESWLVGTYVQFGQESSIIRLQAEQIRQEQVLVDRNELSSLQSTLDGLRSEVEAAERFRRQADGDEISDEEPIKFDRLTIEGMANDLGPIVEAATGEPADIASVYNLFYRTHSAFDTHGLRAIDRYIKVIDDRFEISRSDDWVPAHHTLAISAMYLSVLAVQVFERFGISVGRMETIQTALVSRAAQASSDVLHLAAERGLTSFLSSGMTVNSASL